MMEKEMIKWLINNLKPPYYEKMINTQVTHFASLILVRERINKGIWSKKIVDPEALSSMIEQLVKKATSRKGKEANICMINKAPERPLGMTPAYTTTITRPYQ